MARTAASDHNFLVPCGQCRKLTPFAHIACFWCGWVFPRSAGAIINQTFTPKKWDENGREILGE